MAGNLTNAQLNIALKEAQDTIQSLKGSVAFLNGFVQGLRESLTDLEKDLEKHLDYEHGSCANIYGEHTTTIQPFEE